MRRVLEVSHVDRLLEIVVEPPRELPPADVGPRGMPTEPLRLVP